MQWKETYVFNVVHAVQIRELSLNFQCLRQVSQNRSSCLFRLRGKGQRLISVFQHNFLFHHVVFSYYQLRSQPCESVRLGASVGETVNVIAAHAFMCSFYSQFVNKRIQWHPLYALLNIEGIKSRIIYLFNRKSRDNLHRNHLKSLALSIIELYLQSRSTQNIFLLKFRK